MPYPALLLLVLLVTRLMFAGQLLYAEGYRETSDFADAVAEVEAYADTYGPQNTLLVVDIDNTLLAMQGELGSDQWFEWQEYLLEHEAGSPKLVAKDFSGLLSVQGKLFTKLPMRPSQPDLPELFKRAQSHGIKTAVLTSRGDDFRKATERELTRNGYDTIKTAVQAHDLPNGTYLPYDVSSPESAGLTAEEVEHFGLKPEPRTVSYQQGVFMSAGQHKGAMLLTLLHHANLKPKAVVFVDDHGRHVHRVYDALDRRGIVATVFHYHREDDRVKRFRYSDKEAVAKAWEAFQNEQHSAADRALQNAIAVP